MSDVQLVSIRSAVRCPATWVTEHGVLCNPGYKNIPDNCPPSVWKLVDFRKGQLSWILEKVKNDNFSNKKKQKKIFFFQKNASKAVKNLYTKKWLKIFLHSKMTIKWSKNFFNQSDCKKFLVTFWCTNFWPF